MNWKEFFKPDWKKYLISVAIYIFYIVFIFLKPIIIASWGGDIPIGTVVEVPDTIIDYILKAPFFVVVSIHSAFDMSPFSMSALTINIIFLLNLLWWYFISCLIVYSYDKFKTKQ
ncbi:MAG: hypothetical protein K8R19_02485 [Methanosarcinales archaeon]|nr:hypothetical protein [Methanosarcinales archaeon]